MAVHHVALATRDTDATHRFYTGAMGFRLAKVVAGETATGWSKHLFYDTGDGGFIAFWDIHDPAITGYGSDISTGMGLPVWVNHLAFTAHSLDELDTAKARWLDHGVTVMEVDHNWCRSIYATDPNGILVEFCTMVRELDENDAREAEVLLAAAQPPLEPQITAKVTHPEQPVTVPGA